jgi:hypothetical protein
VVGPLLRDQRRYGMRTIIAVGLAGMIFAGPALAQNTNNRVSSGAGVPGPTGKQVRSTCLSGSEHGSSQSGPEQSSWPTRQQIWARCIASEGDKVGEAASY